MDIAAMTDSLDRFMPHGQCFLWIKELVALHALSDGAIFIAYLTIPLALAYFVHKRGDLQFSWVFMMFAAFILTCGATHALGVWNVWHTDFWLSGSVKALTALISISAAIALWRLMPTLLTLPSPSQLRLANEQLQQGMQHRQLALEALRESEERFRHAFDFAPIGMGLLALDGHWLKVNRELCRMTSRSPVALLEANVRALLHRDDVPRLMVALDKLRHDPQAMFQQELRLTGPDQSEIWVLLSASLVSEADGQAGYFTTQLIDVTQRKLTEQALRRTRNELEIRVQERTRELKETNQQLEIISREDELTGLFNRRHLMEQLEIALKTVKRYGIPLCVMMLDIDHFKQINDKYGHLMGDEILSVLGHTIHQCLRATDIAGRYGGDEFCIAAMHTPLDEAAALAEKLRARLADTAVSDDNDHIIPIKCSIGVVCCERDTETVAELLEAADQALYQAKHAGRDTVYRGTLPPASPSKASDAPLI